MKGRSVAPLNVFLENKVAIRGNKIGRKTKRKYLKAIKKDIAKWIFLYDLITQIKNNQQSEHICFSKEHKELYYLIKKSKIEVSTFLEIKDAVWSKFLDDLLNLNNNNKEVAK